MAARLGVLLALQLIAWPLGRAREVEQTQESTPDVPASVRAGALFALGAFCVACINTFRKFTLATSILPPWVFAAYLIVGSAAWLSLLAEIYRGRNWARIVFIVAAGLAVLSTPFVWSAAAGLDHVTRVINGAQTLMNAVAAALLVLPQSRRWFHVRSARSSAA